MADNNRGRPRDDDRDIYSSSRKQKNSQRSPRYRTDETNPPLRDSKIVLNKQVVLLNKINIETVEGQVEPLPPMKILTAIIMSIVIFTVPQKNQVKMAAVMIYLPKRKKRKLKKSSLQLYAL